jgi:hypothetical protein
MVICLVFFSLFTIEGEQGFGFPLIIKFFLLSPIATFIVEILLGGEKRRIKE